MPEARPRYRQAEGMGREYTTTLSVTANSTEQHDLGDFPIAKGNIVLIEIVATSGTTDCDLSIHEDTTYDKTDMIFRVTGISINDSEPTGGTPSGISGLIWDENNGNSTLHVKTTENSGSDGQLDLRVRYV